MKKLYLLFAGLFAFMTLQAQWVNDPANNTFIANTSADAGEIYLATNPTTGDTYVQWCQFFSNGWSPTLQRLNFEGVPQWGEDGIHIAAHEFSSMSEGLAMTTTTDGGVVSCFADYGGNTYAVKINADGTFAWGEQGEQLFGGLGFSRAEVIATDDGGIWALGFDYQNLYLQYINNTASPVVTISDEGGYRCMYGQLTLSNDNRVFVTYEKCGNGFYTDKEIFVAGYNPDGTQFCPETKLMSSQTFQVTYLHYAISDGMGGGYVYLWHPGIGGAFNTYVFHFDQSGSTTIGLNGAPIHPGDPNYYYFEASATVDPVSHDLLVVFRQTDALYEAQNQIYINRITPLGERVWKEGLLVLDNGTTPCGGLNIDAFEYGDGFAVTYFKGISQTGGSQATVEAQGFDMDGNALWSTQLCSSTYNKTGCENTTGFHDGQNIIAWVNSTDAVTGGGPGGLYGQNIGQNGEMGEVTPPTPPVPCYPPTNFGGEYTYSNGMFGILLSWDAPETTPLYYNLYINEFKDIIQIEPELNTYFIALEPDDYVVKLTAVYEHGESAFAATESGENYLFITVTNAPEYQEEELVTITKVFTLTGQQLRNVTPDALSPGVYILQGFDPKGNLINKKTYIKK